MNPAGLREKSDVPVHDLWLTRSDLLVAGNGRTCAFVSKSDPSRVVGCWRHVFYLGNNQMEKEGVLLQLDLPHWPSTKFYLNVL